jgi:hypothetical protein
LLVGRKGEILKSQLVNLFRGPLFFRCLPDVQDYLCRLLLVYTYFKLLLKEGEECISLHLLEEMEDQMVKDAVRILETVLGKKNPSNFHESLVSGVRLCLFFMKLFPLVIPQPRYKSGRPEHYESNIRSFLNAAGKIVPESTLFGPNDLLNPSKEGLQRVALTIQNLAKKSGRPVVLSKSFAAPPSKAFSPTRISNPNNQQVQGSDVMSVDSSGSSEWSVVISSPLQTFSPLTSREPWVHLSSKDIFGE